MKLNFKSALTDLTQDSLWKIKISIGTILCLMNGLTSHFMNNYHEHPEAQNIFYKAAFYFLSLIISIFMSGFFYKYLHNLIKKNSEALPCWKDSGEIFFIGFKSLLGALVLLIPFFLLNGGIILLSKLTSLAPIALSALPLLVLGLLSLILGSLFILLYLPFVNLMSVVYSFDFKFSSYFKFKKGLGLLKKNVCSYYLILVLYSVLVLASAGMIALSKYNLTVTMLLTLPNFYIAIVWYNLLAQWASKNEDGE